MCCHNKTWSLCCMETNVSQHWNQTLFRVNRCSQEARNDLVRATINQIEAAWNLPVLFTRATLPMWVHPSTIKLLYLWVRGFSLLLTTGTTSEEEVWLKQGRVGNLAFKKLCTATLGGGPEPKQQHKGEGWFLWDLTVCFSAWCIKSG